MEIASQIIGYIATVVTIFALIQKRMPVILTLAIIANALAGTSNLLISGYAGAGVCAIAVVQTAVSLIYEKKGKKVPVGVTIVFLAAYTALTVVTVVMSQRFLDILPGVAAYMYALAVIQKKPLLFRIFMILNSVLWIVYELTLDIPNWAMAVMFAVQLIATVVGIITVDIIGKKKSKG